MRTPEFGLLPTKTEQMQYLILQELRKLNGHFEALVTEVKTVEAPKPSRKKKEAVEPEVKEPEVEANEHQPDDNAAGE